MYRRRDAIFIVADLCYVYNQATVVCRTESVVDTGDFLTSVTLL